MDAVTLSPMDALPYFALPKEVVIQNPTGGTQICPQSPDRVLLIVAFNGQQMSMSTNPNAALGRGIYLEGSEGFLEISYERHGILVNSAWYYTGSLTQPLTVITVELLDRIRLGEEKVKGLTMLQSPATPVRISTVPGVDGEGGLLGYWRKLVAKFGGKG